MIYTLDTNVWIDALRHPRELDRLKGFLAWALPATTLSTVVVAELLAGARSEEARRALDSDVLEPFARRGRLIAPSVAAWRRAGVLLGTLGPRRAHAGWQNDVLLACTARELGWTLITRDADLVGLAKQIRGLRVEVPYPRHQAGTT